MTIFRLTACISAATLVLGAGSASLAQPAPPTSASPGPHLVRLTNSGKGGITAVYVAPPGSLDMSDDLLGKQTAGPGKTVTLKVDDPKAACVFDLQFLMNDGSTVTRKGVNLCQTAAYEFTP